MAGNGRRNIQGILFLLTVIFAIIGTSITSEAVIAPASYVIYKSGTTYYAQNGQTGVNDYSGTVAVTVIQSALNNLTAGRTWKEKVVLKGGDYIFSSTSLDIPSYTVLDMSQAKISGFTVPAISVTGTKNDIEISGGILISGGVPTSVGFIATQAQVTYLSIHDIYMEGNCFNPWPTSSNPVKDDFGILLSGGAKNLDVYNIKAKNIGNIVYVSGGGANWVSENWEIRNIKGEEINGAVYIRSQCKLVRNVVVSDVFVNKWWDGLVEVTAMNGGSSQVTGEINGVAISNIEGYNGAGDCGGVALISENTVDTYATVHGITVNNVTVETDRATYPTANGLAFMARCSGAGNNDIYDFTVNGLYARDVKTGIVISTVLLSHGRGIISNAVFDNVYETGISTANVPSAPHGPLVYKNILIKLNSAATRGILNTANLQNLEGIVYDKVTVTQANSAQYIIQDSPSGGNNIQYEVYYLGYVWGRFSLNSTVTPWKGRGGENTGTATFSGDGTTIAFTFGHGLTSQPTVVDIGKKHADIRALGWTWVGDGANITITFESAPPSGTNNVVFSWETHRN